MLRQCSKCKVVRAGSDFERGDPVCKKCRKRRWYEFWRK